MAAALLPVMHFADSRRGIPYSKDPAVVRLGDRYLLYYSLPPYGDGRSDDGWAMGIAESRNLDDWEPIGTLLPEQSCERRGICAPGAIVLGGKVHLFYQTYGNGVHDAICHAVSDDGFQFVRHPLNPIFRPSGDWNNGRAIDADVVAFQGRLCLYFATRDPSGTIQMVGMASAPLDSDFSPISWVQEGEGPCLRPELPWEGQCIEAPALVEREGRLVMFYAGSYNNTPQQIGCAASDDGIAWKRIGESPFLPNGSAGEWNSSESGHPFIFLDRDRRTHLFYQGNSDQGKTWHLSRAEVTWQGATPVLSNTRPDNSVFACQKTH